MMVMMTMTTMTEMCWMGQKFHNCKARPVEVMDTIFVKHLYTKVYSWHCQNVCLHDD